MPNDPYAPPPRHKERSGALVRYVIIAAILGVAVWGYTSFSNTAPQTAQLAPPVEEAQNQQLADGTYRVSPALSDSATSSETTPAPAENNATPPSEPAPPSSTTTGTPG